MNFTAVGIAVGVVCGVSLVIGLLLGVVAQKFAVETDERVAKIREHLAGSNCGGCGYAGCDACAQAIASGDAAPGACAPAGAENAAAIGEILGVAVDAAGPKRAFVHCSGTCDKTAVQSNYYGITDCVQASSMPGGSVKACSYGCMGMGSCVKTCRFDAIHVIDGVAVVDHPERCTACGACARVCPKHLIELIPAKSRMAVACSSLLPLKQVKEVCQAGCLGCGACVKQCEQDAVRVENHLAVIDPEKCIGCGRCAVKCPSKVIAAVAPESEERN